MMAGMQLMDDGVTRRQFLRVGMGITAVIGATHAEACARAGNTVADGDAAQSHGRLRARVTSRAANGASSSSVTSSPSRTGQTGEQPLKLASGGDRDGVLYVPRDLPSNGTPVPLLMLLHGARGGASGVTNRVGAFALADQFKAIILAPDSRECCTWDVIRGGFGADVAFIDRALDQVFSRFTIDPTRLGIGGFSDGASYALSLGLSNGDLFSHVIAFSPGFMVVEQSVGKPPIFISHGTADEILPIDSTSNRLVPSLRGAGYTVDFRRFAGPHTVPAEIARDAFTWMLGARPVG
jgi:phospholipase/carboxylesterase